MSGTGTGANDQGNDGESLRDTIEAAMRATPAEAGDGEGASAAAAAAPAAKTPASEGAAARDGQGRFAGKTITAADLAAPNAGAAPAAEGAQTVTPAVGEVKAPDSWSAPMKEQFKTLPAAAQAYIAQRENDANKRITGMDADRDFGKRVKETASPYLATIQSEGGTVEQAFTQFLNTAHVLRVGTPQQKQMALRTIAQKFSVDLGQPLQQPPRHPVIESLEQRLTRIEQAGQAEIHNRQQQEDAQVQGLYEAFVASPGHEHLEAVKPLMVALLNSGEAKDYQDAYDKAIWADPGIRSTLTAAEIKAAVEKRSTDAQAKTDGARRAAVSVVGGPGGAVPVAGANGQDDLSLRDQIRANLREATAARA